MLASFFTAIRELFSLREKLRTARKEDRLALAGYLEAVADTIWEIRMLGPEASEEERHVFCVQLAIHSDQAAGIIETVLGPDEGHRIAESIVQATHVRGQLSNLNLSGCAEAVARELIEKLEETVGMLRATAVILRAPAPRGSTHLERAGQIIRGE